MMNLVLDIPRGDIKINEVWHDINQSAQMSVFGYTGAHQPRIYFAGWREQTERLTAYSEGLSTKARFNKFQINFPYELQPSFPVPSI